MPEKNGSNKLSQYHQTVAQLEKARRDAERLRQEAIAELLQMRNQINRELRQLGYEGGHPDESAEAHRSRVTSPFESHFESHEETRPAGRTRRVRPAPDPERQCSLCNVAGHDLRAHRWQTEKQPFTTDELLQRGLQI